MKSVKLYALALVASTLTAHLPAQAQSSSFAPPDNEQLAVLTIYQGKSCALQPPTDSDAVLADLDAPPTEQTEDEASDYRPLAETIWTTCGGLGCSPDVSSSQPELGICERTKSPTDCAGVAPDPAGFCGAPYKPLPPIESIRAQRLMGTGSVFLDLNVQAPDKSVGVDVTVGALYQVALTRSESRELPGGERMHFALPSWYASIAAFASKQRVGYDLGLVYKTGFLPLSRLGIGFFGEGWSPVDLLNDLEYQAGPSLHVETLNNLILRGAWLLLNDQGPTWSLSLQYSANLWDNFGIGVLSAP